MRKSSQLVGRSHVGRVRMWRGGGRIGLSVSAPFVWRCLTSRAVTPFPHPAHRTGRADFPHPALGQVLTPSPTEGHEQPSDQPPGPWYPSELRSTRLLATASATTRGRQWLPRPTPRFSLRFGSHTSTEFNRVAPISWSLATSCVCFELRSLPSTGVTRPQRYYEPLRHPRAPGLSLAGVRLVVPDHALGLPVLPALSLCTCCCHYPGAAPGRTLRSFTQTYQPSPKGSSGRPAHRPFRGLLGIHSRCGLHTRAVTIA